MESFHVRRANLKRAEEKVCHFARSIYSDIYSVYILSHTSNYSWCDPRKLCGDRVARAFVLLAWFRFQVGCVSVGTVSWVDRYMVRGGVPHKGCSNNATLCCLTRIIFHASSPTLGAKVFDLEREIACGPVFAVSSFATETFPEKQIFSVCFERLTIIIVLVQDALFELLLNRTRRNSVFFLRNNSWYCWGVCLASVFLLCIAVVSYC